MYQNKAIKFDGLFWTWGHFFGLNSRQPKINDRKAPMECLLFNCRITINIFLCIAQIGGFAVYILFIAKNFQVKHHLVLYFSNDSEHFNKQTILFSLSKILSSKYEFNNFRSVKSSVAHSIFTRTDLRFYVSIEYKQINVFKIPTFRACSTPFTAGTWITEFILESFSCQLSSSGKYIESIVDWFKWLYLLLYRVYSCNWI